MTWWTSNNYIYLIVIKILTNFICRNLVYISIDYRYIRKIPFMGFFDNIVIVHTEFYLEPCVFKTNMKTTCSAKQINCSIFFHSILITCKQLTHIYIQQYSYFV